MKTEEKKRRYAALMFFQFRTVKSGSSDRRRVCEERIILFETDSPRKALKLANKRGKEEEFSYTDEGLKVFFEFIGIKDLIELGVSLDQDEVWWRLVEKVNPMENRDKLIPREDQLRVFKVNSNWRRRGRRLVPGKSKRRT